MVNRAWVEVSLDALSSNIRNIKATLTPQTRLMAVVKADAYGHGVANVAKALLQSGADALGVACLDEALELRESGIKSPILILGYTSPESALDIVDHDLTPTIFNFSMAKAISNAALRRGKPCGLHVKIDTGMGRIGYLYGDDPEVRAGTIAAILDMARLPGIEIEGVFSHLSCADEVDPSHSLLQFDRFNDLLNKLKENGFNAPIAHICNSAGLIRFPQMHLGMVRPGIIIYGVSPSRHVDGASLGLRPAMHLKTIVSHIKKVGAGTPISYGAAFKAPHEMTVATLPIGYGDGYPRLLTGKAHVIVGGKKVPIVGKICMDQCMIDVSDVNHLSIGDEVTLFGPGGMGDSENIPVEEVADWMGTINYEILCVVGRRVPRVYTHFGAVTSIKNYL